MNDNKISGNDGNVIDAATLAFSREHRLDDPRRLVLMASRFPDVNMRVAADQIEGWQKARHKLPLWAATDGIVFPPHLNMEQCSSEATARYKASVIEDVTPRRCFIDLTGGAGVDFSFMSRGFERAVYVERNSLLCELARHNFPLLGLGSAEVVNVDSIEFLKSLDGNAEKPVADVIFLDPSRRDANGHKVYNVADCEPDVVSLAPELLSKARRVVVKLSPMFDWHEAVRELPCVEAVHIVSTGNECKELLMVLDAMRPEQGSGVKVFCVNDSSVFSFSTEDSPSDSSTVEAVEPNFLLVPNASVMKAGCFDVLTGTFPIRAVGRNSHLFFASEAVEGFPGRQFRITAITTMNKKELRRNLQGIDRANLSTRNFPLSTDALRKRLKVGDGGDTFIFGTTIEDNKHVLIISKKAF